MRKLLLVDHRHTPQKRARLDIAVRILLAFFLASLPFAISQAQQTSGETQQQSAPPAAPSSQNPSPRIKSAEEKAIEKKEQSHRVLGIVPDFGVTDRQDASALSAGEKFHLFAKSAFDPVAIGIVGLQAGLSQAENEFPAYRQGAPGYGKRFGASLADEVSSTFWSEYAYAALLKEDPRYFRLGEGSVGQRIYYSLKQEVVCHTDKGGRSFNFSSVLGAFTSGALSNLYYPGNTLIRTKPGNVDYARYAGV